MLPATNTPVTIKQVAAILERTPATLRTNLTGLNNQILAWRPAPDKWCIKEIIGHLIEADQLAFADRISLILTREEPRIPGININNIAAQRGDCQRDIDNLLDEFETKRLAHVEMLSKLPSERLDRGGAYKHYGRFLALDFVYEWPYHDYAHLSQISDNVRAYIWPNFSKTMQTALSS